MVSNKNAKRARKPIETTLGKAPVKPKEKEADISHLRKPIETNIHGLKRVFSIFENSTHEVKNLLMYECDVMYECRICRTIFRSLANFILHKRNYCRDRFSPLDNANNNNDTCKQNLALSEEVKTDNSALGKVIQRLHEIDQVHESVKHLLTADLSEPGNEPVRNMDDHERRTSNFTNMILEKIDSNDSGIFQTLVDDSSVNQKDEFMKTEVMENHKKIENDVAVLDPDGKICGFTSSNLHQPSLFPRTEFKCSECNHRFATQKSLTNHIKCVHNPSRIVYICPTCKDTFANPWCVYRHLLKVHRMTNKQVRRMREQVHNNWIRRGDESSIQKKKPPEANRSTGSAENQWIKAIEGDKDFQMCAGCGKHFERKAALHSHSQMCAKRLEVCLNIKESAKKKGDEGATEKAKSDKAARSILKGASKRKGKNVYSYRKKEADPLELNECDESNISATRNDNDLSEAASSQGDNNNEILNETKKNAIASAKPMLSTTEDPLHSASINGYNGDSVFDNAEQQKLSDDGNGSAKGDKTKLKSKIQQSATQSTARRIRKQPRLEQVFLQENTTHETFTKTQPISRNPSAESNAFSISSECSSKDTHWDEDSTTKNGSTSSRRHSRSFADDAEVLLASPSSSCRIISRTSSLEEAIYLSTSEESLSEKPEVSLNNSPIKDEKLKDAVDPLSLDSVNSNGSVCIVSDGNEDVDPLLDRDLLSSHVSFETFVKKVAPPKQLVENDDSDVSTCRKRKRKLIPSEEPVKYYENGASIHSDNEEDDVIFVGQSLSTSSVTCLPSENGFHGFPSEEASEAPFSIDFSNLSYNNPLKSKAKESQIQSSEPDENASCQKKSKIVTNEVTSKDMMENDFINFASRAAPYMDRAKLQCIPCGLTFKVFNLLLWHMSAHFSWFRFQCSKCSFISFNKYDCMSHAQKDHSLSDEAVSRYILPLPNWKSVLMSHDFRLLKDCVDLKGKHTDEKIGFEEDHDEQCFESTGMPFNLELDSIRLFGELNSENPSDVAEKDLFNKKRSRLGKAVIDVEETAISDYQKLPEPVELAMPADVGDIFKTLNFDEGPLSPDEAIETIDHYLDESNDDWGLSKVYEFEEPIKNTKPITQAPELEEPKRDDVLPLNIRPSRIRTKVKQDDFVYYDTDINNVLKVTDLIKSGSQKNRSDGVLGVKPKVSGKSVPIQKKKS